MIFDFSDTQKMIRETLRDFVREKVTPNTSSWDRTEEFPRAALVELASLGFLGMLVSSEEGGTGLGFAELTVAVEEIGRSNASLGLAVANLNTLAIPCLRKEILLRSLLCGEKLAAFVSCPAAPIAAKKEKGSWVLDGVSAPTLLVGVADHFLVGTSTGELVLLDRTVDGLSVLPSKKIHGCRSAAVGRLKLTHAKCPSSSVLKNLPGAWDRYLLALSAVTVGVARGALETALEYSKQRHQFGGPIADIQAIQWMLAESSVQVEAAQLLVAHAAFLTDNGAGAGSTIAQARALASKAALKSCGCAVQIHGGYGYIKDYPVERYQRDAQFCAAV
ncbi:MAG: acyl-CoA dehydrogenase family protein [Pseudomonadota bacterium]